MNARWILLLLPLSLAVSGCDADLFEEEPQFPTAQLDGVELKASPEAMELASWYCYEEAALGSICAFAFDANPPEEDLKFSFETIFGLGNANSFPVPMVELLLKFSVFETETGVLCVSFCDPADPACDANQAAEDACKMPEGEEAKDITDIDDLVPTVDELIELGTKAVSGELFDDLKFKVIPERSESSCHPSRDGCEERSIDAGGGATANQMCCGETCVTLDEGCRVGKNGDGETCVLCDGRLEAHIRFDLGVKAMLNILTRLLEDTLDAVLGGRSPSYEIPYEVSGTLFFDIPVLGRFALEFGPFGDTWKL